MYVAQRDGTAGVEAPQRLVQESLGMWVDMEYIRSVVFRVLFYLVLCRFVETHLKRPRCCELIRFVFKSTIGVFVKLAEWPSPPYGTISHDTNGHNSQISIHHQLRSGRMLTPRRSSSDLRFP